jgi:membrane-associated phospholipid phosphatase
MSITGGVNAAAGAHAMSRAQWLRANVTTALALLVRAPRTHPTFAWRTPALRLLVGGVVAVLAVLVAMVALDAWAIARAQALPLWLSLLFNEITDFGKSNWFLVPCGVLLAAIAVLASPTLRRMTRLVLAAISVRAGFLFLAIGSPGLVVAIGKRLIGRARPLIEGHIDPFLFRPFGWTPQYASLPSGHATTSFAAAVALGLLWPKGRPLFWAYAVLIAVSRVAISAHHVSDVLAGAFVGVVGALIVRDWFAVRRLGFVPDGQGGVRTLPGPSLARIKRVARQLAAQ